VQKNIPHPLEDADRIKAAHIKPRRPIFSFPGNTAGAIVSALLVKEITLKRAFRHGRTGFII
jgi:hypothetical protein